MIFRPSRFASAWAYVQPGRSGLAKFYLNIRNQQKIPCQPYNLLSRFVYRDFIEYPTPINDYITVDFRFLNITSKILNDRHVILLIIG